MGWNDNQSWGQALVLIISEDRGSSGKVQDRVSDRKK